MLTPTITSHWSDGKRIHVIGYFGGKVGDVFLQNEDGVGSGTKVKWPNEIKSAKPVIYIGPNPAFTGEVELATVNYLFYQGVNQGNPPNGNGYIKILNPNELNDNTDLSATRYQFYAIFHKFI